MFDEDVLCFISLRLPRRQAEPKVMQRTADFHHQIVHTRFSQTARVLDNAAALDATVDVLDTNPTTRDPPIDRFLRPRELPTPGLLHGHDDLDLVERERQEAEILEQSTPAGKG